ncbi:hypothetical protein E4T56_gene20928, partial [Termitomyces sp. T112]
NLQSANSAIKDVDIAADQSKLSSAEVKTQAAVSALAAANQMPQPARPRPADSQPSDQRQLHQQLQFRRHRHHERDHQFEQYRLVRTNPVRRGRQDRAGRHDLDDDHEQRGQDLGLSDAAERPEDALFRPFVALHRGGQLAVHQ